MPSHILYELLHYFTILTLMHNTHTQCHLIFLKITCFPIHLQQSLILESIPFKIVQTVWKLLWMIYFIFILFDIVIELWTFLSQHDFFLRFSAQIRNQNDSAIILSGDACPQDYTTLKIILCSLSIWGPPRNHFYIKGFGKIYIGQFHMILFLLSFLL